MIIFFHNVILKIAYRIASVLAKTRITANQLTITRFLIVAPLSWYFFSRGSYLYNVIGLTSYMILAIFDWVDGKLARLTGQASLLGKFIDDVTDKILVVIVLGTIFYAGMQSEQRESWILLTILYYSLFFFVTSLLYEFDRMFHLEFEHYQDIEKEMYGRNDKLSFIDRLLLNVLNVHRNSFTIFCFTVSYPLLVGIFINQLILAFLFIIVMYTLRIFGILFIMYRAVRRENTNSVMTKILRRYLNDREKQHQAINQISEGRDKLVAT